MKIGNTKSMCRISFTEIEYKLLGEPAFVNLNIVDQDGKKALSVAKSNSFEGSAVYRQHHDYLSPWACSLSKSNKFRIEAPFFGSETVKTVSYGIGSNVLLAEYPKMHIEPQTRFVKKSPVKKPEPVQVVVEPDRYTLDAAVEFINKRKDQLGENVIFVIDKNGYLEVLQRSGR